MAVLAYTSAFCMLVWMSNRTCRLLDGMKEVGKDGEQIGDREASQPADLEFPRGGTDITVDQ